MQDKIEKILSQMNEKRERLCRKAARLIEVIDLEQLPTPQITKSKQQSNIGKYLLITAAGLAVAGAAMEDARALCLTGAAVSAGAGVLISRKQTNNTPSTPLINLSSLKVKLTSEVISASEAISNEWEEFIIARHESLKQFIESSTLEQDKKEEMLSKLYYYERIKVSYPEISSIVESLSAKNLKEIKDQISQILQRFIGETVEAQSKTYKSLI